MVFDLLFLPWYLHCVREVLECTQTSNSKKLQRSLCHELSILVHNDLVDPKEAYLWTVDGRGTCSAFQESRSFNCTHKVFFNLIKFFKSKGIFAYFPKLLLDSIMSNNSFIRGMNLLAALLFLDPGT